MVGSCLDRISKGLESELSLPKVRDAIRLIEEDGWRLNRIRGSHRHYKHETKLGTVTVAGHPSKDIATGTWISILKQAGLR